MTLTDYFVQNVQLQAARADDRPTPEELSMVKLWHPTKNGDLKPTDITSGSRKKLWWRCERGHEWQAAAYSLRAGTACPYCSGRLAICGETDLAAVYPQLVKMWSPRNQLLPTEVTAASHKKVWWVCEKGHEWEAQIDAVTVMGSGCPYCAGKRAIPGETDIATLCPELMAQWDFEKNTVKPEELTVSAHDKVWWKCDLSHSWKAVVYSRTRESGSGCPYCTGKLVLAGFNDLGTLRPMLAKQWHQSLNGDLRPQDVTLGSNKKVWWRCAEGHVWQSVVYSRTRKKGTGCPVCAGMVKQKKDELPQAKRRAKSRVAADNRLRV